MDHAERNSSIALIAAILLVFVSSCVLSAHPAPEPKTAVVTYPCVLIAMAPEPPPMHHIAPRRTAPHHSEPVGEMLEAQTACQYPIDCGILENGS